MTSFSPAIPTLPYFRDSSQENHINQQTVTIEKATEEASVLLDREVTILPKSSCFLGLTGGIAASFLLENPLPFFLGLSQCFPIASGQQKVGNEFQVNTYKSSSHSSPSVTSFSNGNFVVSYTGPDGSLYGIFGQLFDGNGTKIGSEFQANTYTTNFQSLPSVASFSNGNFVVTWESDEQDGSAYGVYGQLFDGNATKIRNEFLVNTYTTSDQSSPSVTSLQNGNFVVSWYSNRQDGSSYGVYGQLFDGNGSKIGSEFQINTYTNNSQATPSIASSNGNFVVTWESDGQDGDSWGVYGQLFNGNGSKIGSEFQANSYTTSFQMVPSVASFSNGNFVVTWISGGNQDGDSWGVYGQLFDENGTKIGNEFQVNTYTADVQWDPSVASFSDGNFVVTWESNGQDGSDYGVYGQLFDENGTKIGNEFQVNTYTADFQRDPSVASLSNGNFVVTWSSFGQNGSFTEIFGQIFNDIITYTSSSTTARFSTTSTTKTTSSIASSVSSSTMSAIGRTKTSVNPSSSRTTESNTTRPIITRNRRTTLSATSDPRNRFSWIWFLLGGVGVISCLGLTGYFIFKSRNKKKDSDVHALEFGERGQPDDSTANTQYQRTPDFVTEGAGQGPIYAHTPDFVTARDGGN